MVIYLAIIITQPLQATTGAVSTSTSDDTGGTTTGGSQSAGDITKGGVTFHGTYSYKKLEYHYSANKDTKQYKAYSYGYNVAVDFMNNYWNPSTMYFEFYAIVYDPDYPYKYEYLNPMY